MKNLVTVLCVLLIATAHCVELGSASSPLHGKKVLGNVQVQSAKTAKALGSVSMDECRDFLYKYQDYLQIIYALENKGKYIPKDLIEEKDRLEELVAECGENITL